MEEVGTKDGVIVINDLEDQLNQGMFLAVKNYKKSHVRRKTAVLS